MIRLVIRIARLIPVVLLVVGIIRTILSKDGSLMQPKNLKRKKPASRS